jgi:hypothetical protein
MTTLKEKQEEFDRRNALVRRVIERTLVITLALVTALAVGYFFQPQIAAVLDAFGF